MTRWTAITAALLGMVLEAGMAGAKGKDDTLPAGPQTSHVAPTYGTAAPPLGFLMFCRRTPSACRGERRAVTRLRMTEERWRLASRINSFVNAQVAPLSDEELYGEAEYWAYPTDAGDCEDYALLKQRYLERLGFARSALLLTVVLDEKQEGHALLTMATDEGDFILDNRSNQIRNWDSTDYTFLKRQSQQNPRQWVSLAAGHGRSPRVTAAGAKP